MMKLLKKFTLVTTAAVLFCLTATSGTLTPFLVSSITIEIEENAEPTPLPEEPAIQPLADEDEVANSSKTK